MERELQVNIKVPLVGNNESVVLKELHFSGTNITILLTLGLSVNFRLREI